MKKVIVYSLFGYGRERQANCFDFLSYFRSLFINIRMNALLFPGWEINLQTDQKTYLGWEPLLEKLIEKKFITIEINDDAPLTKAMLWRLKPIFKLDNNQRALYSHVLCRDLDSPPTYREAQAVKYWMNRDKAVHAITDSVSHGLPMLGGMVGFIPRHFTLMLGKQTEGKQCLNEDGTFILTGRIEQNSAEQKAWESLFDGVNIDFSRKGADQTFLNQYIYPVFAKQGSESITQHYFLGVPNTFLNDYHTCLCPSTAGHADNCPNNIDLDLPASLKESNGVCGHIGSAGFYATAMFQFLRKYWHQFDTLLEIEKEYPELCYWVNDAKNEQW